MFVLNTSGPLFRNNVQLRRAVNFAVDRKALLRERGPLAGTVTDQYLPPGMPASRTSACYPLTGPDVTKAQQLAKGHTRNGKAVLYVPANPVGVAQAEIITRDLKRIGIKRRGQGISRACPLRQARDARRAVRHRLDRLDRRQRGASQPHLRRAHDRPARLRELLVLQLARYNRLLEAASRLPVGSERYRRYAGARRRHREERGARRSRSPTTGTLTLVSERTGCVIINARIDV